MAFQNAMAQELNGIRGVQIRSENIVTLWLGRESIDDIEKLKETGNYLILSAEDANYAKGIRPASVSCFAKASGAGDVYDWQAPPKMDHYMHLRVESPFIRGKTYTIKLAKGIVPEKYPQEITFSMDDTPNPGFKVNQYGYTNTAGIKHIYLSSFLGDGEPVDLSSYNTFQIISADNGSVVYEGDIQFVSESDIQGKDKLYLLDISLFREEGVFFAWVEGLGRSYPFRNGSSVAGELYNIASRGYYFQRCGTEIVMPYADKWPRPVAHDEIWVPTRNVMHPWFENRGDIVVEGDNPNSGVWHVPHGPLPWTGGHYDAGDFDLRITHVGVADGLMTLYEMMPERFKDGQVFIPESGNGLPDILDEVEWSLRQWVLGQDYAAEYRRIDGGAAPGKEASKHPTHRGMGHEDYLHYFMRKVTPYSSFAAAGVFAQAARVFKPYDTDKAGDYLDRAIRAYDYAVRHKDEKWDPLLPWFYDEEGYNDTKLGFAWTYAAGQLFSTTGEQKFLDDFKQFSSLISGKNPIEEFETNIFWTFEPWRILWPVTSTQQEIDPQLRQELESHLIRIANRTVERVKENGRNGYKVASINEGSWGRSSPMSLDNIGPLIYAYLLTRESHYRDMAATALDFVLGMNPSEMSWVTGVGSVYPMDPLSYNSRHSGEIEPIPGMLLFGPKEYDPESFVANTMHPDKAGLGFFRRFQDVHDDVPVTEYVVDRQNLSFVMVTALLLEERHKSGTSE